MGTAICTTPPMFIINSWRINFISDLLFGELNPTLAYWKREIVYERGFVSKSHNQTTQEIFNRIRARLCPSLAGWFETTISIAVVKDSCPGFLVCKRPTYQIAYSSLRQRSMFLPSSLYQLQNAELLTEIILHQAFEFRLWEDSYKEEKQKGFKGSFQDFKRLNSNYDELFFYQAEKMRLGEKFPSGLFDDGTVSDWETPKQWIEIYWLTKLFAAGNSNIRLVVMQRINAFVKNPFFYELYYLFCREGDRIIPMLTSGCKDDSECVRSLSLQTLIQIGAKILNQAERTIREKEIISTIVEGAEDPAVEIRTTALQKIAELATETKSYLASQLISTFEESSAFSVKPAEIKVLSTIAKDKNLWMKRPALTYKIISLLREAARTGNEVALLYLSSLQQTLNVEKLSDLKQPFSAIPQALSWVTSQSSRETLTEFVYDLFSFSSISLGSRELLKTKIYNYSNLPPEKIFSKLDAGPLARIENSEKKYASLPTVGMEFSLPRPAYYSTQDRILELLKERIALANFLTCVGCPHNLGKSGFKESDTYAVIRILPITQGLLCEFVSELIKTGVLKYPAAVYYQFTISGALQSKDILPILTSTFFLHLPEFPPVGEITSLPDCYTYAGATIDPFTGEMAGYRGQTNIYGYVLTTRQDHSTVFYKDDLRRLITLCSAAQVLQTAVQESYKKYLARLLSFYKHWLKLPSDMLEQLMGLSYEQGLFVDTITRSQKQLRPILWTLYKRLIEVKGSVEILRKLVDDSVNKIALSLYGQQSGQGGSHALETSSQIRALDSP